MNLIEFIRYLKDEEEAIQYMNEHFPDVDYYEAEVYLKGSLSVESELVIFDGEKIEGMIEMEVCTTPHPSNHSMAKLYKLMLNLMST